MLGRTKTPVTGLLVNAPCAFVRLEHIEPYSLSAKLVSTDFAHHCYDSLSDAMARLRNYDPPELDALAIRIQHQDCKADEFVGSANRLVDDGLVCKFFLMPVQGIRNNKVACLTLLNPADGRKLLKLCVAQRDRLVSQQQFLISRDVRKASALCRNEAS